MKINRKLRKNPVVTMHSAHYFGTRQLSVQSQQVRWRVKCGCGQTSVRVTQSHLFADRFALSAHPDGTEVMVYRQRRGRRRTAVGGRRRTTRQCSWSAVRRHGWSAAPQDRELPLLRPCHSTLPRALRPADGCLTFKANPELVRQ